ncbi:hypothetical protein LCGC14_2663100, partial [marine sediment metagenome]
GEHYLRNKQLPEDQRVWTEDMQSFSRVRLNLKKAWSKIQKSAVLTLKGKELYNSLLDNPDIIIHSRYGDSETLGTALDWIDQNPDAKNIDDIAQRWEAYAEYQSLLIGRDVSDEEREFFNKVRPVLQALVDDGYITFSPEIQADSKLNMKKAWDNPPRDDATYPGSNVSGPVPYSAPKSPGSKPRRDQRTTEDYHTPSELERDQIPGDTPPEQGTGGQSHSGEPGKVDNIYPEPSNWLRPLKGLPFTEEHLFHDFNEDFESEYHIRQRGLNMRRVKVGLNMKKAQQMPKWTDPKFLGSALYSRIKEVLKTYSKQIREDPNLADRFVTETIPELITRDKDLYISAGVTLPIMLEAIKEAASLLMVQDKIALDTLHAEQAATQFYPEGPRQQTSEMATMEMGEARLLEELTVDQIWDIARNPGTENTPEGQAARGLIEKGIVAGKLNM